MGLDCFMAGCLSAIYSPQARARRGFVISTVHSPAQLSPNVFSDLGPVVTGSRSLTPFSRMSIHLISHLPAQSGLPGSSPTW